MALILKYVKFSFWETVTFLFETLELCFWVILNSSGITIDYSFFPPKEKKEPEFLKIIFENSELSYFLVNFCLSLTAQLGFWAPWVNNNNSCIYKNLSTLKISPSFIKFAFIWLNNLREVKRKNQSFDLKYSFCHPLDSATLGCCTICPP
jgi:hypothetical protein